MWTPADRASLTAPVTVKDEPSNDSLFIELLDKTTVELPLGSWNPYDRITAIFRDGFVTADRQVFYSAHLIQKIRIGAKTNG